MNQSPARAGETPANLHGAELKLFESIPHDFAIASRTVFYAMAAVMVVAFIVSLVAMPASKVERGGVRLRILVPALAALAAAPALLETEPAPSS